MRTRRLVVVRGTGRRGPRRHRSGVRPRASARRGCHRPGRSTGPRSTGSCSAATRVPQIPCHIASSGSPNAVTPPRPGRRTDFPTASHRCSIMLWCMYRLRHTRRGWEEDAPTHCPVGHPLGPNQALVGSRNCECGDPAPHAPVHQVRACGYTPALEDRAGCGISTGADQIGAKLFVVVVGEQRQRQRQVGDHMRGQLAVRTPLPHPARRDRVIHRVARHRVDQHPEGHLIRTHQRINRQTLTTAATPVTGVTPRRRPHKTARST